MSLDGFPVLLRNVSGAEINLVISMNSLSSNQK